MSTQDQLFHEDFNDALRHAIKGMGGFETVAHDIWPTKARKAAGILLSDCLNEERAAKLDIPDLIAILRMAREAGIHCAIHQLCDEAGYSHPTIAAIKTEQQKIAAKRLVLAQELAKLADEEAALERADAMRDVRALKR